MLIPDTNNTQLTHDRREFLLLATLTSKGRFTLPKEIRGQPGLQAGALLDLQPQADNVITIRPVRCEAQQFRGLLKSPHSAPFTVKQTDAGLGDYLQRKNAAR